MPTGDLSQPIAIVALIALGGFTAKLILATIASLEKRLDASEARVSRMSDSLDKLADVVKDGFREFRP